MESNLITTPERLFYLGVDILRIRMGSSRFQGRTELPTTTDKFQRAEKLELVPRESQVSKYSLIFYQPAFVSSNDYLDIKAQGEGLKDESIQIVRIPIGCKWAESKGFYDQNFEVVIGIPITIHHYSRFYDEVENNGRTRNFGTILSSIHQLDLKPEQIQTFGRRLWQAHLNSPISRAQFAAL